MATPAEPPSHLQRQIAESFGADPERYDRSRPRYPAALVERVVAAVPGRDVLDVGIGTGIVARPFRAAGCRVLGVDADERMAAYARSDGFDVEVSTFEQWDPAGRLFDAVVSGQTWHWIDPVPGAAKAAEALRPGGLVAVFWNGGDPAPEVAAAFAEVYRRVLPDSLATRAATTSLADGYSLLCDRAADGMRSAGGFTEPEQWSFDWQQVYTRDEWLDMLPTQGGFTQLPQPSVDELLAGLAAAVDAVGGSFPVHYRTVAATAVREEA